MRSNRIEWIDFCKGIGIIAMVRCHMSIQPSSAQYIQAWHMPLFFIISGYLFNTKYNLSVKDFVLKKAKAFLIPYICFGLINTLYVWVHYNDKNQAYNSLKALLTTSSTGLVVSGALWFLTCIFFVEVLFFIIYTKVTDKKVVALLIISIGAIGCLYSKYIDMRLFWSLDISMSAIVFYYIGYLLKENSEKQILKYILKPTIIKSIVAVIVSIILPFTNDFIDMRTLHYGNIVLYFLNATIITIGYFSISKLIVKFKDVNILEKIIKLIKYIGANSIVYLLLNQIIIEIFRALLDKIPRNIWGMFGLYKTIIVLLIITLFSIILNKWCPALIGKNNRIKSL